MTVVVFCGQVPPAKISLGDTVTVPITGGGLDIVVDASGLAALPAGAEVWFQAAFVDGAAAFGVSATDGMKVVVP